MKKLSIIIVLLAAATANAQLTAGMSTGISNSKALIQGEFGYSHNALYTGIDLRSHVYAEKTAHIGLKAAYFLHSNDFHVAPVAGYYRRMVSTDNKNLNGFDWGYGVKAGYKWFSIEGMQAGKFTQFTIGVFAFIKSKEACR